MKKTRLVVEYEYDFDLLGIISSVKFYKLAWSINNQLDIRLVKEEDFILPLKNNKKETFVHYAYESEHCSIHLFKNKGESDEINYLIPEMAHIDYVLKIDALSQSFAPKEVIKALRVVRWIEYIAPIDVKKLKSRDNFLS
ncbi:MAG: IPExxxVDY family protein [Fulvivirga sp.]|nr:IPExxxVDY family protein [Fulvivirga sp.]